MAVDKLAYAKEYREKNKAWIAAKNKIRKQGLSEKFSSYKYAAKKRGYEFDLTIEDFKTFWNKPCFYCGTDINGIGIDRIDNNIGYQMFNCVSCCSICNQIKMDLDYFTLRDHLTKMIQRMA
jgi:hypothetical protein